MLSTPFHTPALSAPQDVRIVQLAYDPETLEQILFFKEEIRQIDDRPIREFLLLGLMSILEDVSYTSKDGQYLRLRRDKKIPDVRETLRAQLGMMYADLIGGGAQPRLPGLSELPSGNGHGDRQCYVVHADARSFAAFDDYADIVITSPPYLNRYDYSRIYSLELCLQFVDEFQELKQVRHSLLRSYIESRESPTDDVHHPALVEVLNNLMGQDLNNPRIPIMIKGYFEDMNQVLRQLAQVCRSGAQVALVVANARFHGELIPVDLLFSDLAAGAGFEVERIIVTRYKGILANRWVVSVAWLCARASRFGERHRPMAQYRGGRKRRIAERRADYLANPEPALPSFASTPEEIQRAVERNSIQRGLFFIQNLATLDFASLIRRVEQVSREYDKEEWYEAASALGIDVAALKALDACEPPAPYPYYFCTPDVLIRQPELVMYYRNVAMVSQKAMGDMGLSTIAYEAGQAPSLEIARNLVRRFNRIVSALVITGAVQSQRHLEMAYTNLGASFDGSWRNGVGRLAYVEVITPLLLHLHRRDALHSVIYTLRGPVLPGNQEARPPTSQELVVTERVDLASELRRLQEQRVVYQEVRLRNGNSLLINRQITTQIADDPAKQQQFLGDLAAFLGCGLGFDHDD